MATAANKVVADFDPAFTRVDTRTPAHLLPAGVAADATNKRFDDGRAGPRFGVEQGPWGQVQEYIKDANLLAGKVFDGENLCEVPIDADTDYRLTFDTGEYYAYMNQGGEDVFIQNPGANVPVLFNSEDAQQINFIGTPGQPVTATLVKVRPNGNTVGYRRFNDPQGLDVVVLATDDWRADGGRGRVWKVVADNAPVEIPLNGHDIDTTCRLVPCFNALALLRHGNEKHYFAAAAVGSPAANQIQLNCQPAWSSGDQVFLWGDADQNSAFTGTNAPASGSFCFVKKITATVVELYADANLTQQLLFTEATGRFYLERRAVSPGQFGNGMPPLLAQPTADGKTLWENGFNSVPVDLAVTNTDAGADTWTVPNHRLKAGDAVTLANMPGGHTPADGAYFAFPLNDHQLMLFDTEAHALLRVANPASVAGLANVSNDGETAPTLKKTGASGLPMPPATEGCYTQNNRLVLVNGTSLVISDPLDPLHYTPMQADLTANLGEADAITGVAQFASSDVVVVAKQKKILALYNFSGGPTKWALREVTGEYGCLSAASLCPWGNRLIFLSRRGLDCVVLTAYSTVMPVAQPISYDLKKYVSRIDWASAGDSCVETWNSRLFWAVRLKTGVQTAGNNAVLPLNFTNSEPDKGLFAWEGLWTGDALRVAGYARHTIGGEERLTLAGPAGEVYWLGDGALDLGATVISDSLTTRLYTDAESTTKTTTRKIFTDALVTLDYNNPLLAVTAVTPGYNEMTVLTPPGGLSYDATQYAAGPAQTYDPLTQTPAFDNPLREDYAVQDVTEIIGGTPDVLQNRSEPFRLREDDWAVQLVIANTRGQAWISAVNIGGFLGPSSGRSRV